MVDYSFEGATNTDYLANEFAPSCHLSSLLNAFLTKQNSPNNKSAPAFSEYYFLIFTEKFTNTLKIWRRLTPLLLTIVTWPLYLTTVCLPILIGINVRFFFVYKQIRQIMSLFRERKSATHVVPHSNCEHILAQGATLISASFVMVVKVSPKIALFWKNVRVREQGGEAGTTTGVSAER